MRRIVVPYLLLLLVVLSCGTARKAAQDNTAPIQKPLENPEEIARTEKKAQAVLDSIDRVNAQAPQRQQTQKTETPQKLSDQVIAYARTFKGVPYKLGASGPKAFDCSSFTCYVFKHFGYNITPYSQAQFKEGREVASYSDLQKGDLVFFGKRGSVRTIGHVGIVVSIDQERGSFTFIHASVSRGVTEDSSNNAYFMMRYMGARRILPDE